MNRLSDAAYVTKIEDDRRRRSVYAYQIDVFPELLRHNLSPATHSGRRGPQSCAASSGPTIARSHLTLSGSSLEQFDFFDEEAVEKETRTTCENLIDWVIDAEATVADTLAVAGCVSIADPVIVPCNDLKRRCSLGNPGTDAAEQVFNLVSILYRHAFAVAEAKGEYTTGTITRTLVRPVRERADVITRLTSLSGSANRLHFGDRDSAAEDLPQDTTATLLRADRPNLLERLIDTLQSGLSDMCLREGDIDMDTYTQVATWC